MFSGFTEDFDASSSSESSGGYSVSHKVSLPCIMTLKCENREGILRLASQVLIGSRLTSSTQTATEDRSFITPGSILSARRANKHCSILVQISKT